MNLCNIYIYIEQVVGWHGMYDMDKQAVCFHGTGLL
jgi:hypothetical protein